MDMFSRTEMLIGKENLNKLRKSKVAVFGIGGVGSFVVEGLARAGIGSLILIDSECIDITNINRQIHSNIKTVGRPKVQVMKERILDINPGTEVTIYEKFFCENTTQELITNDYDYIVDAIDTVSSKIELILAAKKNGIPIISSMGAGNKLDPTKFNVADIYDTNTCPLARVIRKELRKRGIVNLKVVYSTEPPVRAAQQTNYSELKLVPASISFVPSVAGLIIAGEVIKDIMKT
ncbi:MAG TPA: tRNA threonylcarbamoyladenosine dehydratase [Clostridiales bacterium]|nr:tRNA threonylcarbamoyladenosine dehydratase [Clostridiales bacterium]